MLRGAGKKRNRPKIGCHRDDGDTGARNKNAVKEALPADVLKANEAPATEALATKALLASEALAKSHWPQRSWL